MAWDVAGDRDNNSIKCKVDRSPFKWALLHCALKDSVSLILNLEEY